MAKKKPKELKKELPLTTLQRRFVEIYHSMKKPKQAKAWQLAGSKTTGKTAEVEACRTLKKPQVKAYLKKLQKKSEERAEKTAGEIIEELENLAFSKITDYLSFGKKGVTFKESSKLTPAQIAAIAEVGQKETKGGKISKHLKLRDKEGPLHKLGLRYGIFPTRSVASDDDGPLLPFVVEHD